MKRPGGVSYYGLERWGRVTLSSYVGTYGGNRHRSAPTSLLLGWPSHLNEAKRGSDSRPKLKGVGPRYDLKYARQVDRDTHLLTFAPTGTGKGVSVIIPNLLHYAGPAIVIDPKGENFAVTARYRRSMGHEIVLLDPFRAISDELLESYGMERGSLNPFELTHLDRAPSKVADGGSIEVGSQMLADALGHAQTDPSTQFWDISGQKLLAGLICHEIEVANAAARQPDIANIIKIMYADDPVYALAVLLDNNNPSEFVKRTVGGGFLSHPDITRGGILATAQTYLDVIISESILPWLKSGKKPLSYFQGDRPYTMYLVIPPSKLDSHSPLLRIWITALMYSIMERRNLPEQRTLFILDECANLGHLDMLKKAVTLLRGYGLQVWMFFQDLAQLEFQYLVEAETMINNCGVMQTFGMARRSAAEALASRIGGYEADDLVEIDKGNAILSISGRHAQVVRRLLYYKDGAFKDRYDLNPLIRPKPAMTAGAASRLLHPASVHVSRGGDPDVP